MPKNKYISLEQAAEVLLSQVKVPVQMEFVPLLEAIGRIAAEDVFARINQPPFNRSPLDGYAVCHKDIRGASIDNPVELRVTQCVCAGDEAKEAIATGEAVRVMTGAPLPQGATCVVRQEDTNVTERNTVQIYIQLGEYENYCWQGEDIKLGEKLLQKGHRLEAAHIASLAGQGYAEIGVFLRPVVGILSTGSELTAVGQPLATGKIYDSNHYYLASRAKQLGGDVVFGANKADDPEQLTKAVHELLSSSDIVVTTGGVSVGDHDYMPTVGKKLEADELFHGVAIKPGAPALALQKDGKLILCLSGNPFAAAATFELLARPAIKKLGGYMEALPKRVRGVMKCEFGKASAGRRLIRARIEGNEVYIPQDGHASGVLASMIGCNCLVDIPAGSPSLASGTEVEVVLL